jgi:hypothetical protein
VTPQAPKMGKSLGSTQPPTRPWHRT